MPENAAHLSRVCNIKKKDPEPRGPQASSQTLTLGGHQRWREGSPQTAKMQSTHRNVTSSV